MNSTLLYPVGATEAITHAVSLLHKEGIPIIDHPAPEITHLLLDVPSFASNGSLRDGGDLLSLLERLPETITVIGGNLEPFLPEVYDRIDLLKDEEYLARNAAITAECTLRLAGSMLKTTFPDTPTLVLGWGRIGKCLSMILKSLGTPLTIAARNPKDRAALRSLGYNAVGLEDPLPHCCLLINTIPSKFSPMGLADDPGCIRIDLASEVILPGSDVIHAKGLPGKMAPESSGALIAERILKSFREDRV